MSYMSWEPRYRVTTIAPGKLDIFVVTLVDGRRAAVDAITEYEAALTRANAFSNEHPNRCQIKVLPLTYAEFCNLFNVTLPEQPEPSDPAERKYVTELLLHIARNTNDGDARSDALDLLLKSGVIQS
ncbi:hypothetical protein AWL63_15345 [Sphingomonas panacis]|uniref:Uncharacterized protein n=1 Tax=Sphingomonas panacis TaxID=1560345 RepID=A0A1B3ZCH4_9SPHN|nr:hypothetical protein [Sphingomonas panacis]AOH85128.1 hypothetical protein AWL63_15345 [Sphingomonas panacis]